MAPLVELSTKINVPDQNQCSYTDTGVFWHHTWLVARYKACCHVHVCFGRILVHIRLVNLVSGRGGKADSLLNPCTIAVCPQPHLLRNFYFPDTWNWWHLYPLRMPFVLTPLCVILTPVDCFHFVLCSDSRLLNHCILRLYTF